MFSENVINIIINQLIQIFILFLQVVVVAQESLGEHHLVAYLQQFDWHVHLSRGEQGCTKIAHQLTGFHRGLNVLVVDSKLDHQHLPQNRVSLEQALFCFSQFGQHFRAK